MQASARYYETGRRRGKCYTYFGSGGPSVFNGFMLSLQRLLNTRKASICKTLVKEVIVRLSVLCRLSVSPPGEQSQQYNLLRTTRHLHAIYMQTTHHLHAVYTLHANYTPTTC